MLDFKLIHVSKKVIGYEIFIHRDKDIKEMKTV